ncbi:MAG: beta-galactosidase, partial [Bacteroidaceae bacterium]|nr:beta-galactosidase [Bacteroidaceae bacterium]
MKKTIIVWSLAIFGFCASALAQESPLPVVKKNNNGRWSLMVDNKPFLILGGQAHNSSTWPKVLPQLWQTMHEMHANTLEIPIYWEQVEPVKGKYDFTMVQMLLDQARQHQLRLVLLWFGTWKNGSNHYMPEWMKLESKRFPNAIGKDGKPVDTPSPHTEEAMKLDAAAFAQVMTYLKDHDPQHTVIMVQVENEPGSWGTVRDYSPKAEKLFAGQVPAALMDDAVLQELGGVKKQNGTWKEVFGERADEYFHAWSVARYIEHVAAAGKDVNPLPLYTNAALRDPLTNPMANKYESGGPTDNVIIIYRIA